MKLRRMALAGVLLGLYCASATAQTESQPPIVVQAEGATVGEVLARTPAVAVSVGSRS